VALTLAAVVGLVLVAAGFRLVTVRQGYGRWAWSPGEGTPRLPFAGRTYLRGDDQPDLPPDVARLGAGPAGSTVFGPAPIPGAALTAVFVRFGDGRVIAYALSGGP
jgi:hypothetical protein